MPPQRTQKVSERHSPLSSQVERLIKKPVGYWNQRLVFFVFMAQLSSIETLDHAINLKDFMDCEHLKELLVMVEEKVPTLKVICTRALAAFNRLVSHGVFSHQEGSEVFKLSLEWQHLFQRFSRKVAMIRERYPDIAAEELWTEIFRRFCKDDLDSIKGFRVMPPKETLAQTVYDNLQLTQRVAVQDETIASLESHREYCIREHGTYSNDSIPIAGPSTPYRAAASAAYVTPRSNPPPLTRQASYVCPSPPPSPCPSSRRQGLTPSTSMNGLDMAWDNGVRPDQPTDFDTQEAKEVESQLLADIKLLELQLADALKREEELTQRCKELGEKNTQLIVDLQASRDKVRSLKEWIVIKGREFMAAGLP